MFAGVRSVHQAMLIWEAQFSAHQESHSCSSLPAIYAQAFAKQVLPYFFAILLLSPNLLEWHSASVRKMRRWTLTKTFIHQWTSLLKALKSESKAPKLDRRWGHLVRFSIARGQGGITKLLQLVGKFVWKHKHTSSQAVILLTPHGNIACHSFTLQVIHHHHPVQILCKLCNSSRLNHACNHACKKRYWMDVQWGGTQASDDADLSKWMLWSTSSIKMSLLLHVRGAASG